MVYLFGQIVWIFGHTIAKIPSQFRCFFFENTFIWTEEPFKFQERPFFLENTSIWAEKTVSILTEKRNASSHFSGKSLLPPPNHFELLRPCKNETKLCNLKTFDSNYSVFCCCFFSIGIYFGLFLYFTLVLSI